VTRPPFQDFSRLDYTSFQGTTCVDLYEHVYAYGSYEGWIPGFENELMDPVWGETAGQTLPLGGVKPGRRPSPA
jgi:hypothetical protein